MYFTLHLTWQGNLFSHPMKTHTDGVWGQRAEGNILTEDREVIVRWRNPDTEELCNKYYLSINVRVIKTYRMRRTEMYKA